MSEYDVIIVGGSFAGLSTAMQLRGRRVLVVDRYPVGTHQTSTCGMPLAIVAGLGVENSVLETHYRAVLHMAGQAIAYTLPEPYVTVDYRVFCETLLAHTRAQVLLAKVTGYEQGTVRTTQGPLTARFVVDASGWQSLDRKGPSRNMRALGYGVETELPISLPVSPGLHFYYEKRIVRSGYAWVFPCGNSVRIGVCSFDKGVSLGPVLDAFLARFGLRCGTTHGGAMPMARRHPMNGDMFVVGDAGGQCMPIWAEGIRPAMFYGAACGQAIAEALNGRITDDEARTRYGGAVMERAGFQRFLLALQGVVGWLPEWGRAGVCGVLTWPPLTRAVVRTYLHSSGWLEESAALSGAEDASNSSELREDQLVDTGAQGQGQGDQVAGSLVSSQPVSF